MATKFTLVHSHITNCLTRSKSVYFRSDSGRENNCMITGMLLLKYRELKIIFKNQELYKMVTKITQ